MHTHTYAHLPVIVQEHPLLIKPLIYIKKSSEPFHVSVRGVKRNICTWPSETTTGLHITYSIDGSEEKYSQIFNLLAFTPMSIESLFEISPMWLFKEFKLFFSTPKNSRNAKAAVSCHRPADKRHYTIY